MSSILKLSSAVLLGALAFQGAGVAQAGQDALQAKFDKKIAKEFVSFGGWVTDYDKARDQAKSEDKVIFVYFSRSYAP